MKILSTLNIFIDLSYNSSRPDTLNFLVDLCTKFILSKIHLSFCLIIKVLRNVHCQQVRKLLKYVRRKFSPFHLLALLQEKKKKYYQQINVFITRFYFIFVQLGFLLLRVLFCFALLCGKTYFFLKLVLFKLILSIVILYFNKLCSNGYLKNK